MFDFVLDFFNFELNFKSIVLFIVAIFSFSLFLLIFVRKFVDKILPTVNETRLKDFLPFLGVDQDKKTILCNDNTYVRVFLVDGLNMILVSDKEKQLYLDVRKKFIESLDSESVSTKFVTLRQKISQDTTTDHTNFVLKKINDKWNEKMRTIYSNKYYVVVSVKDVVKKNALQKLNEVEQILLTTLSPFSPKVLLQQNDLNKDSLLDVYSYMASPISRPNIRGDVSMASINELVSGDEVVFNKNGVIEFRSGEKKRYMTVIGLKRVPDYIDEQMYSDLMTLDYEMIFLKSLKVYPNLKGAAVLNSQKRIDLSTNFSSEVEGQYDYAIDELNDIAEKSQKLVDFGEAIYLYSDNLQELEKGVEDVFKVLRLYMATPARETWVAQISWFCLFPSYDIVPRVYKLLSRAVACSLVFERVPTGFMGNDWGDGCISMFPTANGTNYRFQFHISSAPAAVAHSVVIGPTGIGKTTLYAFLCGAAMRYPKLKAYFFDRNRGIEIFTNAVGGSYLTFVSGKTKDIDYGKQTYMNPLKLPDSPENRQFLRQWLKAITYMDTQDYIKEEAGVEEEIARAVSVVYDYLDYDLRSLKNIYKSCFNPKGIVRQEIKRWVDDEQYGMLFNSPVDNLDLSSQLTSFDFTNIFEDPKLAPAIISYIMNQINNISTRTGDPSLVVIDETAPMLENPMFRSNFIIGLQEGRKKRQAYMAAFQQPNIIDKLGVGEAIRGQCQTVIFFKNPQATSQDYAGWNLNEKEMAFIAGKLYPELRYAILIKRPFINESVILNIDLSFEGQYLKIFDSGRKSVVLADEILKKMGAGAAGTEKYFNELLKSL